MLCNFFKDFPSLFTFDHISCKSQQNSFVFIDLFDPIIPPIFSEENLTMNLITHWSKFTEIVDEKPEQIQLYATLDLKLTWNSSK